MPFLFELIRAGSEWLSRRAGRLRVATE